MADKLSEIKARLAAATPWPWRSDCILPPEHMTRLHTVRTDDKPPTRIIAENCYERDGVFIAHAPADIAYLLRLVETMEQIMPHAGHQRNKPDCTSSRFEVGERTPDGGYRWKVAGKWYASKDDVPCECGLKAAWAAYLQAREAT